MGDPHHAIVLPPGTEYRVSHPLSGGDQCTLFVVFPGLADNFGWDRREESAGPLSLRRTDTAAELLHQTMMAPHESSEARTTEWAATLLSRMMSGGARDQGIETQITATRRAHRKLVERTVVELMRRKNQGLNLNRLARDVFSSPFHLSRVFRKSTGLSLHQYHERLRLRDAAERVLAGEPSLSALAHELGFVHHSYFTERFRREYGLTPRELRQRGLARELLRRLRCR